jgi:hypothetical protein
MFSPSAHLQSMFGLHPFITSKSNMFRSSALISHDTSSNNFHWTTPTAFVQGENEPARVEIEQQKYLSALPFLPPLTEKSLTTYYTIYGAFFGAVILFGGLLAPLLEVRIGVGGEPALHAWDMRNSCKHNGAMLPLSSAPLGRGGGGFDAMA